MPSLDSKNLYSELDQKKFRSFYLIYGEEEFLQTQALAHFRQHVVGEGFEDFNLSLFYGGECDIETVVDTAHQLPMMASHRLVVLKNADQLKDSEWALLEPLLEEKESTTVFVVFCQTLDKRKKMIKKMLDLAAHVEMKKPYDNQIPQWIQYFSKNLQLNLADEGVGEIHRRVGPHLAELYLALERLRDFVGESAFVNLKDVQEVLAKSKDETVFEFIKWFGLRKKSEALMVLQQILDQGQNGVGVVLLLARQVRILLQLKHFQSQGVFGGNLAAAIQVPPYFLDSYLVQAKEWKMAELETALVDLSQLELQLKSSKLNDSTLIESFIFKI